MTRTPDDFDPDDGEVDTTVLALTAGVPIVAPPPAMRDQMLSAVAEDGLVFRFAADSEFRPTRYPGVSVRMLHIDRERSQFSCLMRMAPGAEYPPHAHDGPEQCLVLEGSILVDGVRLRAGDYQYAQPGRDHAHQRTDEGALLFLSGPLSLLSA